MMVRVDLLRTSSKNAGTLRGEQGAVAIVVAVAMVALLSVVALVVDLGGLYKHDRDLQTMADAGALAGAQQLIVTQGDQLAAGEWAEDYVAYNAAALSAGSVVNPSNVIAEYSVDATSVTVDLTETGVPFSFARVFGRSTGEVHAHARAEVKYVNSLSNLFPVAIMYMQPKYFQLTAAGAWQFDLTSSAPEEDPTGIYDVGGTTCTNPAAGTYPVTLQAMDAYDNPIFVNKNGGPDPLPIGNWRVFDRKKPNGVWGARLNQDILGGDSDVTVTVEFGPEAVPPEAELLSANLGSDFSLHRQDTSNVFVAYDVTAPGADPRSSSGYTIVPLTVDGFGTLAEYVAFVDDAPLKSMIFDSPEGYAYSDPAPVGSTGAAVGAIITSLVLKNGDPYVMALGKTGNGLYSGNWRHADLYTGANIGQEIAELDPSSMIPELWGFNTPDGEPFQIDGQIQTQTGGSPGPILHALDTRTLNNSVPQDDARRIIFIPIVDFSANLAGNTWWTIIRFASFKITDYSKELGIVGEFVDWATNGSHQDSPTGLLYVETAVLTK